jgi:hypothetical protein
MELPLHRGSSHELAETDSRLEGLKGVWLAVFENSHMAEMAAGDFPKAFKLTNHPHSHPVWKLSDILAHLETRGLVLTNVDTAS